MKLIVLLTGLVIASEIEKQIIFDNIQDHDEFNIADVDGIGFDRLEMEMRKRKIPLPPSMRQNSQL